MMRIFVDIDKPYDEEKIIAYVKVVAKMLDKILTDYKIYVRKSANEKIHLAIETNNDVDLFTQFIIRALFDDDPKRIKSDLIRLYHAMYVYKDDPTNYINRIWSVKIYVDVDHNIIEVKRAGKWKLIYQSNTGKKKSKDLKNMKV